MRKKKILLCHNYYASPGGESHVFDNEVRGLREKGHPVVVYDRQNSDLGTMTRSQRAKVVPAAFSNPRTRKDLDQLIAEERPEIAIIQNIFPLISPGVYPALKKAGIPVIQAVYNYRLVCPNGSLYTRGEICERCVSGSTFHAVRRRCYKDSYLASSWYAAIIGLHRSLGTFARHIDRYLVPDQFLGDKLTAGGFPADRIRTAPNPFFVDDYDPATGSADYLLYVGRLVPQKGIMTLIDAVSMAETQPKLVIVGSGELSSAIEQKISDDGLSGTVSLYGQAWGDTLQDIMAKARAVMVPSEWYDNLPFIVCQANACGKPVIASRINGIPEYVRDGVNGFLFSPGNVHELASVIDRVVRLPDEEMKALFQSSRSAAEREFDYDRHYEMLSVIFDELHHEVPAHA